MSYLLDFKNWGKLFEAEVAQGTQYRIAFTGSTPSKAPNKSALQEFMGAVTTPVVDSDKMDDTKAVTKVVVNNTAQLKVIPKTIKATNYLKLGEKLLNGDGGKGVTITVTKEELMQNPYEASGNGIFSLGRAIKMLNELKAGEKIIIGMNNPTANSFIVDTNSGMNNKQVHFYEACQAMLISSKAIFLNGQSTSPNILKYQEKSKESTYIEYAKTRVNTAALPTITITPEIKSRLLESSIIDSSDFVNSIKDKKLTKYDTAVQSLVNEYVNLFFEKYITTITDRFKKYLEISAASENIPTTVFSEIFSQLDNWKKNELSKKSEYLKSCQSTIEKSWKSVVISKAAKPVTQSAKTEVIKGTEGKL